MKLVVMTQPTFFVEEDKILTALFEEGMECLHLNKPGAAPIYSERLLTLLPDFSYRNIVVHEHFYLKDEYSLRGIHLDGDDASALPDGYRGHLSRTCSSVDSLREAKRKSEYVFLKGVFCGDGGDKATCIPPDQLESASDEGLIDKKVYAFGGVCLENIKTAKELGFGGVVVCADLWRQFDIHRQPDYKQLIAHFDKLRKAAW